MFSSLIFHKASQNENVFFSETFHNHTVFDLSRDTSTEKGSIKDIKVTSLHLFEAAPMTLICSYCQIKITPPPEVATKFKYAEKHTEVM